MNYIDEKYVGNELLLREILRKVIELQNKYNFSSEDRSTMENCINELISFSYANSRAIEHAKNYTVDI